MKSIISGIILAGALALTSLTSHAQGFSSAPRYDTASLSLAGIGTIATNTTQTVTNQFIDCRGMQNVTLQVKFNLSGAGSTNVVYTLAKSIDKTNWETTPQWTWTIAANGTTDVVSTTNLNVGGLGWLKLVSIQNTDESRVMTNKQFAYSIKRAAP